MGASVPSRRRAARGWSEPSVSRSKMTPRSAFTNLNSAVRTLLEQRVQIALRGRCRA